MKRRIKSMALRKTRSRVTNINPIISVITLIANGVNIPKWEIARWNNNARIKYVLSERGHFRHKDINVVKVKRW